MQPRHTSLASRVDAPRSGKKRSGSTPRQFASSCQFCSFSLTAHCPSRPEGRFTWPASPEEPELHRCHSGSWNPLCARGKLAKAQPVGSRDPRDDRSPALATNAPTWKWRYFLDFFTSSLLRGHGFRPTGNHDTRTSGSAARTLLGCPFIFEPNQVTTPPLFFAPVIPAEPRTSPRTSSIPGHAS